jgi:hypothetical protein
LHEEQERGADEESERIQGEKNKAAEQGSTSGGPRDNATTSDDKIWERDSLNERARNLIDGFLDILVGEGQ